MIPSPTEGSDRRECASPPRVWVSIRYIIQIAGGLLFLNLGNAGGILFSNLEKPRSTSGWVVCQAPRFFFIDSWLFSSVKSPQKVQLTGTFGRWYSGHHQHFRGSGPGSIPGGGTISESSIQSQNKKSAGLETVITRMAR